MNYIEIVNKVSEDTGLSNEVVNKTYKAYWKCIKDLIQKLPLKEELSEEDFNKLRTNINIPSLGKLAVTWDRYLGVKKKFNYIKQIREKNAKNKED